MAYVKAGGGTPMINSSEDSIVSGGGYIPGCNPEAGGARPVPLTIGGLKLWLDANDLSSITKDGSNLVSQWSDKSGLSNNATQAVSANRPIYSATAMGGKPALTQTGSPQCMELTSEISGPNFTMFGVVTRAWTSSYCTLLGHNTQGPIALGGAPTDLYFYDGLSGETDWSITWATDTPVIISGVMPQAPGSGQAYKNENALTRSYLNASNFAFKFNRIGVRDTTVNWVGAYSEILIYDSALSGADFLAIITYLKEKWNIA